MSLGTVAGRYGHNSVQTVVRATRAMGRAMERLGGGVRLHDAGDDPVGIGVADSLRAARESTRIAARNINDGLGIISVADGSASEVASLLVRMRELLVQGASGAVAAGARAALGEELTMVRAAIDQVAGSCAFNDTRLLDGALSDITIQVGARFDPGGAGSADTLDVPLFSATVAALGVDAAAVSVATAFDAQQSLAAVDAAITAVSAGRAAFGAAGNRLDDALRTIEGLEASSTTMESRIRDADFGMEAATLAQAQVMQQAGTAVLAQTRRLRTEALQLLPR
jgi:flagellin